MIPGIVLAAGRSSRMGRAKFALPFGAGQTFASRIAASLDEAAVRPLIMVASPDGADGLRTALDGLPGAAVVVNERPDDGQLSSLQMGLAAIVPDAAAVLVTLVDLPAFRAATAAALVEAWRASRAPLVRPVRGGRHGHPFLAGGPALDALRRARPGQTIRDVLQPFVPSAVDVPCDDEGAFDDVDTPADYARLLERSGL
jgi:CTP:molybdopterin cytidylyltransferase MocA